MAEYISFAPTSSQNVEIGKVVVSVIGEDHEVLVTDAFGARVNDLNIHTILLEPGDYTLWARADGHVFPFPLNLTVQEGDGPEGLSPRVVDLVADRSSVSPLQAEGGWCRVQGQVGLDVPGGSVNRAVAGFGIVEASDFGTRSEYQRSIRIWRIEPSMPGESRTLHKRENLSVTIDRNGHWECILRPESLYRIDLPNVAGQPYFTTPEAGQDATVQTLIDTAKQSSPYELIGGS